MYKLCVIYPPQPDLAAFKSYYVEKHIPLARKIPGLQALRYSLDVQKIAGEAEVACIFEAEFADGEAFGAAMGSPEGQEVAGDVANFAQVAPTIVHYAVEGEG